MRSIIRAAAAPVAATAILLTGMPFAAAASTATPDTAVTFVAAEQVPGAADFRFEEAAGRRPHYISGYTDHARQRMAERRINEDQVESAIVSKYEGQWQPQHRTWLVTWGGIAVAISEDAKIVTVERV
ncbi:DUF4258 domain-containing protein [Nocardia brasiliensis]|uniref:DUF4258 domain-containing protein n=1 Tax=Nocardia brasiliensis TaxID=37326 RepID=UPI0024565959|nr:DUF4258 domain-containing protein [Nocardia brasiliensis]